MLVSIKTAMNDADGEDLVAFCAEIFCVDECTACVANTETTVGCKEMYDSSFGDNDAAINNCFKADYYATAGVCSDMDRNEWNVECLIALLDKPVSGLTATNDFASKLTKTGA